MAKKSKELVERGNYVFANFFLPIYASVRVVQSWEKVNETREATEKFE